MLHQRSDTGGTFDVQGHRGARGLAPENTVPAVMEALKVGVSTLEMDVVIAKDGTVVVSHDPWMSSVICSLPSGDPVPPDAERRYRLFDMTYDEIAAFDCGRRGHPDFPRQRRQPAVKPRLGDVIRDAEAYVDRHDRSPVRYSIETKSRPAWDGVFHPAPEPFTRALYDVLVEMDVLERSVIQSFDVRTLQVAHRMDATWKRSLLVDVDDERGVEGNLMRLGATPEVYSPEYRLVTPRLLKEAHGRGMQVIPWTVNDLEGMKRLEALGVDGLITDYPDVARVLLGDA